MTTAANVQKLPGSGGGAQDRFFAEHFGPNGSCVTWPAVQSRSKNDSGSSGWRILIKLEAQVCPHIAHLGFDDRGDDDEISLKKRIQRLRLWLCCKIKDGFKTDLRYAAQKLVEEAFGGGGVFCEHTVSLRLIYQGWIDVLPFTVAKVF